MEKAYVARDGNGPPLSSEENKELAKLSPQFKKGKGGRRLSKKRPTARRRRSSKRKARKSRITRRR